MFHLSQTKNVCYVCFTVARQQRGGGAMDAGMVPIGQQEECSDTQTNAAQHTVSAHHGIIFQ